MVILKIFDKVKRNKVIKMLLKVLLGLSISALLTILCILFTPSIFKTTLNQGLELLPKNKYLEYKVQTKNEFAKEWLTVSDTLKKDELLFDKLRTKLPEASKKDIFFADMFVVHNYPSPCLFTLFGKHRTMDVIWTVKGKHCKGRKECNDPLFIEHCDPLKRSHK